MKQKVKTRKTGSMEELVQKYLQAPKGSATERLLHGLLKIKDPDYKIPKK